MKNAALVSALVLSLFLSVLRAEDTGDTNKATSGPDVPKQMYLKTGELNPRFVNMHAGFCKAAKSGSHPLVFLGDSITEGWMRNTDIFQKSFGAYKPANFGIGWDRTQGVLWRLLNGELEGKPKAMVVLIGTNNMADDGVEGTARGIAKVVSTLREQSPETKILLLGILPRGKFPDDHRNPYREKIRKINELAAKLEDGKNVKFLDMGEKFLAADGSLLTEAYTADFLHLTSKGYQIWADTIEEPLKKLMAN